MDLDFSCIQYPNPTLLQGAACRGFHLSSLPRWALSCSTLIGSIVCWLRSQNILNIPPSVSTVIIGCNVLQKYRFHILSLRASVSMGLVTLPTKMSCQGGVLVWSSFQNSGASFKHLGEVQATLQDGQGLSTVIVQGYVYAASPARLPQVKRPQSANSLAPSPSYKQTQLPTYQMPCKVPNSHTPRCSLAQVFPSWVASQCQSGCLGIPQHSSPCSYPLPFISRISLPAKIFTFFPRALWNTMVLIFISEQSMCRSTVNVQYQAGGTHVFSPFGGLKMCHDFFCFCFLNL